jgi:hypothetical protein
MVWNVEVVEKIVGVEMDWMDYLRLPFLIS